MGRDDQVQEKCLTLKHSIKINRNGSAEMVFPEYDAMLDQILLIVHFNIDNVFGLETRIFANGPNLVWRLGDLKISIGSHPLNGNVALVYY